MSERYPIDAPGWAAIDRALAMLYPDEVPHQFASKTAYDLEQPSPLPAIAVYAARPSSWHFVTYGLSELFEKTSQLAEISGFGFELTLRLHRSPDETEPPEWALRTLHGIGGYVLGGHGGLDSGHCIDLGGPIAPGTDTRLTGFLCVPDFELGQIETPHGRVLFLQLFGLTPDELPIVGEWSLERKVGLARDAFPLGVIDPARLPMREDEDKKVVFRRYELGVLT